jgi:diadenosine tetraphosphate (Ap4A) HIT family hydrolase
VPLEMPSVRACPFCIYSEWEVIQRGNLIISFVNLRQRSEGSALVSPIRHVPQMSDLTAAEADELAMMVRYTVSAVAAAYEPDGMHVWCGGGVLAGQSEPHMHFQIVPRFDNRPYTFAPSNDLPRASVDERLEIVRQVRAMLVAPPVSA